LRGLGAFYIKRKIDAPDGSKDFIYRRLLQTYLQESIQNKHNIEFFIEGGRTRTGKPLNPKVSLKIDLQQLFLTLLFSPEWNLVSNRRRFY
jgi:glycerol-3-phosphate O-acyltransferase